MLLELQNLSAGYGITPVLHDVNLHLKDGEIVALIGPNGAGKSTLLKAIFGLADITGGSARLHGRSVAGLPTHELLARGIGYVPQGRLAFGRLTVEENLRLGAWLERDRQLVERRLRQLLDANPILLEKRRWLARNLSGGQQQLLAIARALMYRPRVLLVDEPSLGLSPQLVTDVFATIERLRGEGLSLVIVEQNVQAALRVADRGYVLVNGHVRYEGTPEALLNPQRLRELFLG